MKMSFKWLVAFSVRLLAPNWRINNVVFSIIVCNLHTVYFVNISNETTLNDIRVQSVSSNVSWRRNFRRRSSVAPMLQIWLNVSYECDFPPSFIFSQFNEILGEFCKILCSFIRCLLNRKDGVEITFCCNHYTKLNADFFASLQYFNSFAWPKIPFAFLLTSMNAA